MLSKEWDIWNEYADIKDPIDEYYKLYLQYRSTPDDPTIPNFLKSFIRFPPEKALAKIKSWIHLSPEGF